MRHRSQYLRQLYLIALADGLSLCAPCNEGQIQALLALTRHLYELDPEWILDYIQTPFPATFGLFSETLHQPKDTDAVPSATTVKDQDDYSFLLRIMFWIYRFDLAWLLTAGGDVHAEHESTLDRAFGMFGFAENNLPARFLLDLSLALRGVGDGNIGEIIPAFTSATPYNPVDVLELLAPVAGLRQMEIAANVPPEFKRCEMAIEWQKQSGREVEPGEIIAHIIINTLRKGAGHGFKGETPLQQFHHCPITAPCRGVMAHRYERKGDGIKAGRALGVIYELPTDTHIPTVSPFEKGAA